MYTTLSPCDMCTGACILYKVKRVVVGENKNFVGGEDYLKKRGVDVVVMENEECKALMKKFIKEHPELWYTILDDQSAVYMLILLFAGMKTLAFQMILENFDTFI